MGKLEASSFLFSGCTPIETAAYLSLKGPLKILGAENTAGFILFIRHCILNPECLPRQARDKHRKLGGTVALALKSKMTKPGNVDTKKCVCAGEFATGALEGVLLTRGYDMLTLRKASTAFAVREKKRLKSGCSRCSVSILLVFVFGPEPVLANHHDSCRFMKVVELGCENCSQAIIFRCCCFRAQATMQSACLACFGLTRTPLLGAKRPVIFSFLLINRAFAKTGSGRA
jgi:hypothetical protein